jgi:hypothetical protein
MWPRLYISEQNCPKTLSALTGYQYIWDDKRGMWGRQPYHNWASHWGDVIRYLALAEDKMTTRRSKLLSDSEISGIVNIY